MEEVYIVKLKNLPPPSMDEPLSKDASFYYQTDLTAEAIRGFGYLHMFFGFTLLCLSVTNLCFHDNPLTLQPPLGITVWCSIAFILLGLFSLLTAHKRRCDLASSVLYVKVLLVCIVLTLSLTLTFVILFILDLHGPISNQLIGLNMLFSITVEGVILLLSLFTTARILWPNCVAWCARDWPMQPTLKRKVIIKTNVFTNGMQQQDDSSMIQSVGPNCVISLNMPPLTSASDVCSSSSPDSPRSEYSCSSLSVPRSLRNTNTTSLYGQHHMQSILKSANRLNQMSNICRPFEADDATAQAGSKLTMQTFPSGEGQACNPPGLYNSLNRLLYRYPASTRRNALFRDDGHNKGKFNPTFSGDDLEEEDEEEEEEDPYDTDEFDYCSTEDDDVGSDKLEERKDKFSTSSVTISPQHNTSTDEGNASCEDEDKSLEGNATSKANSEVEDCSAKKAETITPVAKSLSVLVSKPPEDEGGGGQTVVETRKMEEDEKEDDKSQTSGSEENLSLHDEGIGHSSGSSTCSGEDAYHLYATTVVANTTNDQAETKTNVHLLPPTCYKSSITINGDDFVDGGEKPESPPPPLPRTPPPRSDSPSPPLSTVASKVSLFSSTLPLKKKVFMSGNVERSNEAPTSTTTSPTIRFLTTTKSSLKHKLAETKSDECKSSASTVPLTTGTINGKLASHPYLCRLRASPGECFERRYPKYVGQPQLAPPSTESKESESSSTESSTESSKSSKVHLQRVNYRIADIERV